MKYQKRKRTRSPLCDTKVLELSEEMLPSNVGSNLRNFAGGSKIIEVTWN
jgi:hypothetical protein